MLVIFRLPTVLEASSTHADNCLSPPIVGEPSNMSSSSELLYSQSAFLLNFNKEKVGSDRSFSSLTFIRLSKVSTNKTRYIIGAILAENGALPNEQLKTTLKEKGYTIARFPEVSHAVKTMFPFKCTLSIFIALIRVYPQLGSYLKERRLCAHPILEVYDDCNIHFIAPLAKQNEFYVAEAQSTSDEQGSDGEESISATETSKSHSNDSTSELSHRSVSTLSNVASDGSTNTTATAEFNEEPAREITESSKSESREKSLTPAEDITPFFSKQQLSPGSVDDDQEWENLENFKTQEEEDEHVGPPSSIQETTHSPFDLPSQIASLAGVTDNSSPEIENAAPVVIEATMQESISSRLEESGFSESLLSTLQDSGLGSEETSTPHHAHNLAASANTGFTAAAVNESSISSEQPERPQQLQPTEAQQQQPPQLVEIESDTASEHSNSSSSYEEVKLTEITDA
ncbi:uncharacterized protein LOC106880527 [Octopus bimaculoides]|nr:uncharacterized protein LOC106880527 [Octopus bimaculoides]|eukprot:XP_014785988.1 PREDICTED: uncharacterized protein LOC106880527 [Octopus bimaculoides]